ncbi:unnamed protein product [Mycena citricolor]|uniref:Uncharacterized protein n=1 Tax=Mycena citricolor TaxID=2018698 RepID=A0AAD2K6W2_9AGAR|nr:unnamed protein product [Mycena citricolor]
MAFGGSSSPTRPSSPPDARPIHFEEEIVVESVEAEAMQGVEDVAGVYKGQEGTLDQGHIDNFIAFGGADASADQVTPASHIVETAARYSAPTSALSERPQYAQHVLSAGCEGLESACSPTSGQTVPAPHVDHSADASALQTPGPVHPALATNNAPTPPPPSESALSFHRLDSLVEGNVTDQALPVLERTAEDSTPSLFDIVGSSRALMLGTIGKLVLKSHIDRILDSIRVAGEETGLSPSQILHNISNSSKLPELRTIDNWNTSGRMYKRYPWYHFCKAFPDDPCPAEPLNDSATFRACYDTFKENQKGEEALQTSRVLEAQMLEQTKVECCKIFQKAEKVANNVSEACHRMYHIEGQDYLCDSVINEDGSLGASVSSRGFKQYPITEGLRTLTLDELHHLDEDGMPAAARSSAYALLETSGTQMMSSSGGPPDALVSLLADASANPLANGAANPADASAVASLSTAHQLTLPAPGLMPLPALPTVKAWNPNLVNQTRSALISGHRHLVISNIRTCATIDIGSEPLRRQCNNFPWAEAGARFLSCHCLLSGHPAAVRLPAEVKLRRMGAKGSGDWDDGSLGEFDLAFKARGRTPNGQWNGNGLGFRRQDVVPGSFVIFTHDYRFGPSDPLDPEAVRRHFASSGGEFLPAETTNGEVWLVNYDFDLPNPIIAKKELVEDSMKVFRGQVSHGPKKAKEEGKGKNGRKGKGKQKAKASSHRSTSESESESDGDGGDQRRDGDDDTKSSGADDEQAVGITAVMRSQSSPKKTVAATTSKTKTPEAATTSSTPAEASASPLNTSAAASASTGKTAAAASVTQSIAESALKPKTATTASATVPDSGAAKQVEDTADQPSDHQVESASQAVHPKRKAAIVAGTRWEKRARIDQSTLGRKRKAEEPVSAVPPAKKPKSIRPKRATANKQFKSAETVLSEVEEAVEEAENTDNEDNASNKEKAQGTQSSAAKTQDQDKEQADNAGPAPPNLRRSARERHPPPSKQIGGGPQDAEPRPSDSWPPVKEHEIFPLTRKQLDFLKSLESKLKTTIYVVQKSPSGCQHLSSIRLGQKIVGWCFGSLVHPSPQYLLFSDSHREEAAQPVPSGSRSNSQPALSSQYHAAKLS